jgi:hypothetical protein
MGDGNGKFRPADNVSRIEWLKMLLVSLGIDPDENGLGDDPNWAANTQSLAVRSNLVTGKELALDWNRETAVLYAFKAMQLAQSSDWQKQYVSTDDTKFKFVRQYAPKLDSRTDEDDFKRPTKIWVDDTDLAVSKQTVYATGTYDMVASYENESVKIGKILDDLGEAETAYSSKIEKLYIDGYDTTVSGANQEVGGRGSVIEVYEVNNKYRVVVINTYAAKATETTYNGKKVGAVENLAIKDGSVKKDDIVLYTKVAGALNVATKIVSYEVIEGTDAQVSAVGTDKGEAYLNIGGEKKFKSATYVNATYGSITEATFYYDTYGNVILTEDTTVFNKTVDGYLYVTNFECKAASTSILNGSDAQAKLEVIDLTTGTKSVVNQAVVYDPVSTKWFYAKQDGTATSTEVGAASSTDNNVAIARSGVNQVAAGFYGYYLLDDGSYVLEELSAPTTVVATDASSSNTSGTIIDKGVATVAGAAGIYADANTTLTYLTATGATYTATTVTGIANFPKLTGKSATKVLTVNNDKNKITAIYVIEAEDGATVAKTYGMFKDYGEYDYATGVQTYYFVVNNDVVSYTKKTGAADNSTYTKNKVYDVSTDAKGELVAVANDSTVKGTVVDFTNDYIVVNTGSNVVVYYSDDVQKVDATKDQTGLVPGAYVVVYKGASITGDSKSPYGVYVVVVDSDDATYTG